MECPDQGIRWVAERTIMESKFGSRRKAASKNGIIIASVASFVLGAGAVGYYWWQGNADEPLAVASAILDDTPAATDGDEAAAENASSTAAGAAEAAETAVEAVEAVERVAEQQGGLDQRLAAAEQRLTRLDLQTQSAASNAARAEALLIAFATRRSLERGAELGYLADQLRIRFGDRWPNAVRTVISFSRDPVRLDQLMARLEGLGPQLTEGEKPTSWEDFKRELSDLFVIRRHDTPSSQPEKRLERARFALESGRIDTAIGEVEKMPGAADAEGWIADAIRYREAMGALDIIETAAVVDQSGLRDGAGNPINQPLPDDLKAR